MKRKSYFTVLSIAGSDSIGGAGIQADIKTCQALDIYAMTVVTAVTAQNTLGVKNFESVSTDLLRDQMIAVFDDVMPDAVKIGMLPDIPSIKIVGEILRERSARNIVLDPVMVATSGDSLTTSATGEALMKTLFPLSIVVTPNIPETESLSGIKIKDGSTLDIAANELQKYARAILIKGGHSESNAFIVDKLFTGNEVFSFSHPKIETINTHGTGCSLSSAIACFLARGENVENAVRKAVYWLQTAIDKGKDVCLGKGHGPVEHLIDRKLYKIISKE